MNDEEILKIKQEFCDYLCFFADDFEKTTDIILAAAKITAFVATVKTSSWWKLAKFMTPLFEKGE